MGITPAAALHAAHGRGPEPPASDESLRSGVLEGKAREKRAAAESEREQERMAARLKLGAALSRELTVED